MITALLLFGVGDTEASRPGQLVPSCSLISFVGIAICPSLSRHSQVYHPSRFESQRLRRTPHAPVTNVHASIRDQ